MPWSDLRRVAPLLAIVAGSACSKPASDASSTDTLAAGGMSQSQRSNPPAATQSSAVGGAANASWRGMYALRGSLEQSRSATGTLAIESLDSIAPTYDAIRNLVRITYPSYAGPYYKATLTLTAGADTVRGELSCAHGPTTPPNLVCHPTAPIKGLENATLVVQPEGKAVLTGSHTEGVTVDYGRFTWTKA